MTKMCYGCTGDGAIRIWYLKTHCAVEVYVPFWSRGERGVGDALGIQRAEQQSHGNRKADVW